MLKKYKPKAATLELTLACNMKCIHCGSSAGVDRKNEISTEEWLVAINDLKEMGCKLIVLMGGEPFLRKDWYKIAQHVKNKKIKLSFISNGYSIDNKTILKLKDLDSHTVGISLDGASAKTHDSIRGVKGSYNKCIQSIESLIRNKISTSIITTVHKLNYTELPKIREYILNKNIAWQIQMADPIGRFPMKLHLSKKEFYSVALFIETTRQKYSMKEIPITGAHCMGYHSKVLKNLQTYSPWRGCQAGISNIGILSNGDVTGCLSLPHNLIEGNIRKTKLEDIWNKENFCSYNRNFRYDDLKGDCKNCKYGKKCKGGCQAVSISMTDKTHNNPFCLYSIEKNLIN